jgi:curved DNA-binding protein CbpA
MMVINAAYKVLKSQTTRNEYDRKRKLGFKGESAKVREKPSKGSTAASDNADSTSSTSSTSSTKKQRYVENPDPFNAEYGRRQGKAESLESLTDILSELWNDIRDNKGSNIFDDLIDYFDVKVRDMLSSYLIDFQSLHIYIYVCVCI